MMRKQSKKRKMLVGPRAVLESWGQRRSCHSQVGIWINMWTGFAAGAGSNLGKLKISQDCVLAKFKAKLYCVNPLKDVDSLLLIYWIIWTLCVIRLCLAPCAHKRDAVHKKWRLPMAPPIQRRPSGRQNWPFARFVSFPHIVSRPYTICQQASLLTTGGWWEELERELLRRAALPTPTHSSSQRGKGTFSLPRDSDVTKIRLLYRRGLSPHSLNSCRQSPNSRRSSTMFPLFCTREGKLLGWLCSQCGWRRATPAAGFWKVLPWKLRFNMAATSRRRSSILMSYLSGQVTKNIFLCFFSHLRFRLGSKEKGQYEVGKVKSQRKTLPLCCKTWHQVGSFNWIRNQSTWSFSTTLSIFWEKKTSCPLIVTLNRRLSSEDWGSRLADSRPLLSSHHRPTSKKRS